MAVSAVSAESVSCIVLPDLQGNRGDIAGKDKATNSGQEALFRSRERRSKLEPPQLIIR